MMRHLVLTSGQTRDAEAGAIEAGTPSLMLMHRAGQGVADAIVREWPAPARISVLCGPGNNGGDGFAVACRLSALGYTVTVHAVEPERMRGDAGQVASEWGGEVLRLDDFDPTRADLVVDALLGIGLARDVDDPMSGAIERALASRVPVLAVDVPSGLDADTGRPRGTAFRAARTVTFISRKPGHLLYPGRDYCGEVEVVDIGVRTPESREPRIVTNAPATWSAAFPRPTQTGHKYDRGHAVVLSGGATHTGAARLAARGALRVGAGLVTVFSPGDALLANAVHLTAIMLRVCEDPAALTSLLHDERFNALALGPALGVGPRTRDWVEAALSADRATVLDADALTSFSGNLDRLADLVGRQRSRPVVLTPHDGEFRRLFGEDAASIPSKVERALAGARRAGAILILKGPDTVIAAPDGRVAINRNGSPHLATAGSGDVLGGIVAGLLAQGMPGFEAACAAVWLHAEAATAFGPGLIAEDLPEMLPQVLTRLRAGEGRAGSST